MQVSLTVDVMTSLRIFRENLPLAIVNTVAPIAPTAAASVGEAMPAKIDPNTATIKKSGGNSALPMRARNCKPVIALNSSVEIGGATSGRRCAMIKM